MSPSRPLRRSVAALVCLVCLSFGQVVAFATSRPASLGGDAGSGPPTWTTRAPAATPAVRWSDVPKDHWARTAIDYVAGDNAWMRDYRQNDDGTYRFEPDRLEPRRLFARALVRAFVPSAQPDPELTFPDLASSDRFFPFANVTVSLGWMRRDRTGAFRPADPVTMLEVHHALVSAMGLGEVAADANAIHLRDGTSIEVPKGFGDLLIGMRAGLRYNHHDPSLDVLPTSQLSRAEVAWSLYRAATAPSWLADSLAPYRDIELPNLGETMQRVVTFGVRYVGYPYVWGGEWDEPTSSGYCCGTQPIGGFDCSGLAWWLMKAASGGWDNAPPRPYRGWDLPQRSSADMASAGTKIKRFDDLRPGDLVFYHGDGDGRVDHVDTYLGNGWALDSGSSVAGVTLVRIDDGWYRDHFVRARRLLGT